MRVFERVVIIGLNGLVIGAAPITGASKFAHAIASAYFFALRKHPGHALDSWPLPAD